MSGYHGKKRYWCVTCKRGVTRSQKLEHTHAGHVLVGRPRKKRVLKHPIVPDPVVEIKQHELAELVDK